MSSIITYKIFADVDGKLKSSARTACNFWNRFVQPAQSIVIRLGTFTSFGSTIARAYQPYEKDGVIYGVVEFNTEYLASFDDNQIAGTIVHEIGHTLGFGWENWLAMFDENTGRFKARFEQKLPELERMRVETDYGPGTMLSHWDEEKFDTELMTGIKDEYEHVLPVTVDVMTLLGHRVIERLPRKTALNQLLDQARQQAFTLREFAKSLDLDHFVKTPVWEEVYSYARRTRKEAGLDRKKRRS